MIMWQSLIGWCKIWVLHPILTKFRLNFDMGIVIYIIYYQDWISQSINKKKVVRTRFESLAQTMDGRRPKKSKTMNL